jgi:hypothetical protein
MIAPKFSGCLAVPSRLPPQASHLLRLFGFSPQGGTSLPVCVSHRIAFSQLIDDCRVMIVDC